MVTFHGTVVERRGLNTDPSFQKELYVVSESYAQQAFTSIRSFPSSREAWLSLALFVLAQGR